MREVAEEAAQGADVDDNKSSDGIDFDFSEASDCPLSLLSSSESESDSDNDTDMKLEAKIRDHFMNDDNSDHSSDNDMPPVLLSESSSDSSSEEDVVMESKTTRTSVKLVKIGNVRFEITERLEKNHSRRILTAGERDVLAGFIQAKIDSSTAKFIMVDDMRKTVKDLLASKGIHTYVLTSRERNDDHCQILLINIVSLKLSNISFIIFFFFKYY